MVRPSDAATRPARSRTASILRIDAALAGDASGAPTMTVLQRKRITQKLRAVRLSLSLHHAEVRPRAPFYHGTGPCFRAGAVEIIQVQSLGIYRFRRAPSPRLCARPGVRRG